MHLKSLLVVALVALLGPVLAAPSELSTENKKFENGHIVHDKELSEKWFTNTFGAGLALTQCPITQAWMYGNAQIVNYGGLNGAWNFNAFNPYYGAIPVGANIPIFPANYGGYFGGSPFNTFGGFNFYNGFPGYNLYNNFATGRMGLFGAGISNFAGANLFSGRRFW